MANILFVLVIFWICEVSATCKKYEYNHVTNATFSHQHKCRWYESNGNVVCVRTCNTNSDCYGYSEQGGTCFACFNVNVSSPDPNFQAATSQLLPSNPLFSKLDADECADTSYCLNGGSCMDAPFKVAACSCIAGFTGTNCETNIDECVGHSCQNGATCVDGINSYTCTCVLGYGGNMCQTNINDCSPNPCQNAGTCTDGLNSFTCNCRAWATGTVCENMLYKLSNTGTSLAAAKTYCTGQGLKLAMINDAAEAAIIKDMVLNGGIPYSNCLSVWIDGETVGSTWTWSDGSTNRWLQWGNGEPNNGLPACLVMTITPIAPNDRRFFASDNLCNYGGNDFCPLCK